MIAVKNRGKVRIKKLSRNHRLTWSRKFCLNKFLTDLLDSLRYLRLGWIWNHHQPNINHIINPRNLIPRLPKYHRVSSTSSFFFIMTAPALRKLWTLLCDAGYPGTFGNIQLSRLACWWSDQVITWTVVKYHQYKHINTLNTMFSTLSSILIINLALVSSLPTSPPEVDQRIVNREDQERSEVRDEKII